MPLQRAIGKCRFEVHGSRERLALDADEARNIRHDVAIIADEEGDDFTHISRGPNLA